MPQQMWVFAPGDHFVTVNGDGQTRMFVVDDEGGVWVSLDPPKSMDRRALRAGHNHQDSQMRRKGECAACDEARAH